MKIQVCWLTFTPVWRVVYLYDNGSIILSSIIYGTCQNLTSAIFIYKKKLKMLKKEREREITYMKDSIDLISIIFLETDMEHVERYD